MNRPVTSFFCLNTSIFLDFEYDLCYILSLFGKSGQSQENLTHSNEKILIIQLIKGSNKFFINQIFDENIRRLLQG